MEHVGFGYEVKAKVTFYKWEIEAMLKLAKTHYDYHVNLLADEARLGDGHVNGELTQMLWAWNPNMTTQPLNENQSTKEMFSFRTLDTMCKALESAQYIRNAEHREKLFDLFKKIYTTCQKINEEHRRLNP